jgi:hypothetical protein
MRIPILLAFVALALYACSANRTINLGQTNLCADDPPAIPTIPPATRRTTSASAAKSKPHLARTATVIAVQVH